MSTTETSASVVANAVVSSSKGSATSARRAPGLKQQIREVLHDWPDLPRWLIRIYLKALRSEATDGGLSGTLCKMEVAGDLSSSAKTDKRTGLRLNHYSLTDLGEIHYSTEAVLEGDRKPERVLAAEVLMAVPFCPTLDPARIAKHLHRAGELDDIAKALARVRDQGIFDGKILRIEWDSEEYGDVAFLMDAMTVAGEFDRSENDGKLCYKITEKPK